MSRFEPDANKPYATCEDCGETFPEREQMSAHLTATSNESKSGRSHGARITNRSRAERIKSELDDFAESALYDFVNSALDLTDEGVSEEEISAAVRSVVADFADAWERRDD